MKRAVCPGSFDPITYGHLDIIERAAQQFDHVVVAVLENRTKASLFTVQERIKMISEVTSRFPNVSVDSWSGLLVDYCKSNSIQAIVKGLRAVTDFDYELQMAQVNLQGSGVETMFMATSTPTSITVVETKTSISPFENACIVVSLSSAERRPCRTAIRNPFRAPE